MGQQANQAKGLSHSGKNPASGLGKPYVLCSSHLDKKCPGWATLEALTINPFCACGVPFMISRKTVQYWEGDGTFGGTLATCIAKGI
eukprot:6765640-Karenia_brevis.AAC.1